MMIGACGAVVILAVGSMTGCVAEFDEDMPIDDTTPVVVTAQSLVTAIPHAVTSGPDEPVSGTLGVEDGCAVVIGEDGTVFIASAPRGYALSSTGDMILSVQREIGIAFGTVLHDTNGVIVPTADLIDVSDVEGLEDCAHVSEQTFVIWDLEGMPSME